MASTGLQSPRNGTDPAVVETNRAIALADTFILISLHVMSLVGLLNRQFYGVITSWMAFVISMYWPTVFWMSLITYRQGDIQHEAVDMAYLVITAFIAVFSGWGSWYLCRSVEMLEWHEREFD